MKLHTLAPPAPLAPWIHHFWVFESRVGLPESDLRVVVPNGRPKLIVPWRNGLSAEGAAAGQLGGRALADRALGTSHRDLLIPRAHCHHWRGVHARGPSLLHGGGSSRTRHYRRATPDLIGPVASFAGLIGRILSDSSFGRPGPATCILRVASSLDPETRDVP